MDSFFSPRQRQAGGFLLAIGLGAFLGLGAAQAKPPVADDAEAPQAFGVAGPSFQKSLKPVRPTPSEAMGVDLESVPSVRLKALDHDALMQEDLRDAREGRVKIQRYAVGRDLQVSVGDGSWYDLAGGKRLWVAEVVSTDALAVRLHFKDVRLPAGAELAVYGPSESDPARGVVKSGSPLFDPDRYVEHYEASEAMAQRSEFWTGNIFGDRVRIEYMAPAGAPSDALPFAVDGLQHAYLDPVAKVGRSLFGEKMAGNCHNNVACYPEYADVARSVALITIPIGGGSGFCTGQLLNTSSAADFTPFFLTANHCLSASSEAAGSEVFWLFQSATCGGPAPALGSVPRSLGASLLSTSDVSDYSLIQIEGALPDGLFWSGWTSANITDGTPAVAIHHPSGDFKRISFAEKNGLCEANFLELDWTDGPTEPGSSGSGVFRADNGQLFGQLFGGPSACGNESFDCYGAFSTTYGRIKNIIKTGSDDNSEQNDSCKKAKNAKAGKLNGRIVKVNDTDWYKVSVPKGKTVTVRADFANDNGDIDLAAFANCNGGDPIVASTSSTDSEEVTLQNVGNKTAFVYVQVYLDSDTRNSYNLSVSLFKK
jgi:Trypsin-like peptidase domain